jgi:DNA replication protein DnaC
MNENPQDALIELYAKELKLPALRQAYPELAKDAESGNKSYQAFLSACLAHELETRRANQKQRRLKAARFPWVKSFGDFDFTVIPKLPKQKLTSLAGGSFVRERENIICIGASGTGKTHTLVALGVSAIEAGYKVRFIKTVELVQELLLAEKEFRLPRYLKSWQKIDLVLLDELGYISLGSGGPLLFQFCADRYEQGSIAISSNLEFSRWGEVFNDPALTTALLDRLTHRSHVFLFEGESYRFRENQKKIKAN